MIYICDKKTEFLTFLNKRILDLPYVCEELISKLFDKNDKISKIIKYFKEHSYHYNNQKKFYFNEKEINENLTIEEVGLKKHSIIIICQDNIYLNMFFIEAGGKKYTVQYKPFELISTLIERYRDKSKNFGENIQFIQHGGYVNPTLISGLFLKSEGRILVEEAKNLLGS